MLICLKAAFVYFNTKCKHSVQYLVNFELWIRNLLIV